MATLELPLTMIPITTVPKVTITKHRYFRFREDDIGLSRKGCDALSVSIAILPQLSPKDHLRRSIAATICALDPGAGR
jgi:hypothetical protein